MGDTTKATAKVDKLAQIFEMAEEALTEIVIEDGEEVDINLPAIYVEAEDREELITITALKSDLRLIRETLLSTVHQGKLIIETITRDIVHNGLVDAKLVDACANLINSTNTSLKSLTSIFRELNDIEEKKNKKNAVVIEPGNTNVQNNIFVGNANDLMSLLNNRN